MKVSYVEDLANHNDPESCVIMGNCSGEALTGGDAGQVLSREKSRVWGADAVDGSGRRDRAGRNRETGEGPARSETLSMHPSTSRGSREIPRSTGSGTPVRTGNSEEVIR
jgi:RNA-directed DNA polymerase